MTKEALLCQHLSDQLKESICINHLNIDMHRFVPISQRDAREQHCSFTDTRHFDTLHSLRSAVTQVSDHPGFITILDQALIPVSLLF